MTYIDKVVVITGAGAGLGRELALQLANRGAHLALNDYSADAVAETVDLLPSSSRVITAAYDVSDREPVLALAERVKSELGGVDMVINNAGTAGAAKPAWAIDPEVYERVLRINVMGVIHGTQAYLPQMLEANRGAIVNIASMYALAGVANSSDYAASKFAVRGFTESLAAELGKTEITAHLVFPGAIRTELALAQSPPELADKYITATPEEVARDILNGVEKGREHIITGSNADDFALAARFLPRSWAREITSDAINKYLDLSDYPEYAR